MSEKAPSTVKTWDPFADLDLISRWPRVGAPTAIRSLLHDSAAAWSPAMDVSENDDRFVVTMELAGSSKDDVIVEADGDVLTIRGEKRSERTNESEQRRYVERSFGRFSRSFTLPTNADPDAVNASFSDGILTVEIGKRAEPKPKSIVVE